MLESYKLKPPSSIDDRGVTSLSMQYKRGAGHGSVPGVTTPSNKIDRLIRENIKRNKEKEIVKEIEEIQIMEDFLHK